MEVRKYIPEDLENIVRLFRNTVQSVNRQHYSAEQIAVWSDSAILVEWEKRFRTGTTVVALWDDRIIAFGRLSETGWLDLLYTDREFQNKGAGSAILQRLEAEAKTQGRAELWTEASINAKPFFLSRGYKVVREQEKVLSGIGFTNYLMYKRF
ncbi:GNAT family N-acetyltransferase [Planococcus lenghuensis]|uniref:N-acetyltransferase domain-containing protein n=1 Tax=Planococcus lenghuensis TaxID=2213202 RepID=A0A1Q2KWX9_9BACL|nr:GNAT family N-acetyltransferase [Planococcus lenghuensis]AQQ52636.1 hypothetical protein B0X71_05675 [Planococcus lenghuensis]